MRRGNHHCRWCGGMVTSWNHQMHRDCKPNDVVLRDAGFIPATWKMERDTNE